MPKQSRATDALREDKQRSTHRKAEQAPAAATTASANDVAQIQARDGNRAVQRLLSTHTVQAKLEVGPAFDNYEQEADRVAQQVMHMPADTSKDEDEEKP